MAGDPREAVLPAMAKCDCCEERCAFLYCKADSARLCLACDHHVHAANPLSLKHARAPLCERCGERVATLLWEEETRFLCAACEQGAHGREGHTISKAVSFSGCISPGQLASAWKCNASMSPCEDVSGPSRIAGLDDTCCWPSDGSQSGISASCWTNSWDRSGSLSHYPGEQNVSRLAFLEQLDQLWRLQTEGDVFLDGSQQEIFEECMAPPIKQFHPPYVSLIGQTCVPAPQQQEMADQSESAHFSSYTEQRRPSANGISRNLPAEMEIPETEGNDVSKQNGLLQNANELSWIMSQTPMVSCLETANVRIQEPIVSVPESNIDNLQGSKPVAFQIPHSGASMPGCTNSSKLPPRKTTEMHGFTEHASTSYAQLSDLQGNGKSPNGRSHGSGTGTPPADCVATPTTLDTEASAQARDSAMMRYKEKKKNRKFEKFVRYESRKARAQTRLRIRGRFVKASGLNYESLLEGRVG